MHDISLNEERVYINWRSCKVRDFCECVITHNLAFGHTMRECTEKDRMCEECTER